jgi:2-O-methyltransferase
MTEEEYLKIPIGIEKKLQSYFKKDGKMSILDIGSCEGLDSIKYSRLFPNAKIFAFEPMEKNYSLLEKNILKFKATSIQPFKIALSNNNGTADFFISSGKPEGTGEDETWDYGNKSSSLLQPDKIKDEIAWLQFKEKVTVETIMLQTFCATHNIQSIDLIHMDVQGAELMVLEGAQSLIQKIKVVWLEVEKISLYKNQPFKNDIEAFMTQNGFAKIKDTAGKVYGDQLWVNLKFFPKKSFIHKLYNFFH